MRKKPVVQAPVVEPPVQRVPAAQQVVQRGPVAQLVQPVLAAVLRQQLEPLPQQVSLALCRLSLRPWAR
jgi:hypothetical protein